MVAPFARPRRNRQRPSSFRSRQGSGQIDNVDPEIDTIDDYAGIEKIETRMKRIDLI
jgi:hypothetical protein